MISGKSRFKKFWTIDFSSNFSKAPEKLIMSRRDFQEPKYQERLGRLNWTFFANTCAIIFNIFKRISTPLQQLTPWYFMDCRIGIKTQYFCLFWKFISPDWKIIEAWNYFYGTSDESFLFQNSYFALRFSRVMIPKMQSELSDQIELTEIYNVTWESNSYA